MRTHPSRRGRAHRWALPASLSLVYLSTVVLLAACGGGGGGGTDEPSLDGVFGPNEVLSGGDTTAFFATELGLASAFSAPAANLEVPRIDNFFAGNSFFDTNWVIAPSSTVARDGLGPVFNARACVSCHARDGRGRPPSDPQEQTLSLLMRLSLDARDSTTGQQLPEPTYGGQFQNGAVPGVMGLMPEGRVSVSYTEVPGTYGDGTPYSLRRPTYTFVDLGYGPMDPNVRTSPRIGSIILGLGLLQAVSDESILARADPMDADGDGISGKAQMAWDVRSATRKLGRFGWKAGATTLEQQTAAALRDDIGITNTLFPTQPCTAAQGICDMVPDGGSPESSDAILEFLTFYVHTVAVPARRNHTDPQVRRGRDLFHAAGCVACHVPTMRTGTYPDFPELENQIIHPFTDLLLHDMGPGLADGAGEFEANGSEWRTAPLWGIGLVDEVNEHQFLLHDGRARGFAEAILWHGGEAEAAKEYFRNLPAADRDALIAFLEDL